MSTTFFGANSNEPWVSDGSSGGTHLVGTLAGSYLDYLATINGVAFFTVDVGGQSQVWRSDGTAGGTFAVSSSITGQITSQNTVVMGGALFFIAANPNGPGSVLFRATADAGSAIPVMPVFAIASSVPQIAATASHVYVFGLDSHGAELWRTDGTPAGSVRLTDLGMAQYGELTVAGDRVVLMANIGLDFSSYQTPWISDGTVA